MQKDPKRYKSYFYNFIFSLEYEVIKIRLFLYLPLNVYNEILRIVAFAGEFIDENPKYGSLYCPVQGNDLKIRNLNTSNKQQKK